MEEVPTEETKQKVEDCWNMTTAFDSFDPDNIRLEDVQEFTKRRGTRAPMVFARTLRENKKNEAQHLSLIHI